MQEEAERRWDRVQVRFGVQSTNNKKLKRFFFF